MDAGWGELVQETATRLERIETQAEAQPKNEEALISSLQTVEQRVCMLLHKAQYAATLQARPSICQISARCPQHPHAPGLTRVWFDVCTIAAQFRDACPGTPVCAAHSGTLALWRYL